VVDFEVTMDPIEEAQAIGLLVDPERHHIIPDGEWVRWLKRWSGRKDLFMYYHLEVGTFVLAVWVIPGKVATELMVFDCPPDHFLQPLPTREELEKRLRPADMQIRQMKADFHALATARKQSRLEAAEARKEAAQHLRRKGMDEAAQGMDAWRPWTADDSAGEASVFDGIGKVMA
jgi:hypothetical protein